MDKTKEPPLNGRFFNGGDGMAELVTKNDLEILEKYARELKDFVEKYHKKNV